jgi:hypothetical protein
LLLVREDDAAPSTPLVLEQARYDVTVTGLSARTRATLVFRNDLDRILDGELVFPLPEGALISGFALDVNGRMGMACRRGRRPASPLKPKCAAAWIGSRRWVRGNNFTPRFSDRHMDAGPSR